MLTALDNSKETIRQRLLKYARDYWESKDGLEYNIDPVVNLMIEALSVELYNLSNDIIDSQARVLEKIADLMAPDFLTCPHPAHAIATAIPIEPVEILTDKTDFFTQTKLPSKKEDAADNINVYFTPVDDVQIFSVQVVKSVTSNRIYQYDNALNKRLMSLQSRTRLSDEGTLWVGIKIDKKTETLNKLSIYFNWRGLDPQHMHRTNQLLQLTKWYIKDHEIHFKHGLIYNNDDDQDLNAIFGRYDLLSLLKADIKQFYDERFVTLNDDFLNNVTDQCENYPTEFSDYFSANDLQKFTEKLLWIKIVFPAVLKQELLDDTDVSLNAFPVINRRLIDKKYRLNERSNIVPLETASNEHFMAMQNVADDTRDYRQVAYRKTGEEEIATYALRSGGVERFDTRNAKELIISLFEALRNDSLAFSALGLNNISKSLDEINQSIKQIEAGIRDNNSEIPSYVIIKPPPNNKQVYLQYWATLAEIGNNLRAGSRLQQFSGTRVKSESVFLLSPTLGGRSRHNQEEKTSAYKYGLMTRNRIVTKEDIRTFCFYEMGNRITSAQVEKGFEMSVHPQKGFNRTIDVTIVPSRNEVINNEDWQILCEELRSKLSARSGISNNYRIILKQENYA